MAFLHNSTQETPLQSVDVEKGVDQQGQDEPRDLSARTGVSFIRSIITLAILTYMNLVTHIAFFAVTGAMPYLKTSFKLDDSKSGSIHLVYVLSSMLFGLVYGFLGDRWNRKYIMCVGMSFWAAIGFGMSFVPNENFTVFLLIIGLLGAAGASLSTTASSFIASLFEGDRRSRVLYIYHLAVPLGHGLGYIMGSKVTSAASGDWHWIFRISSALGSIGVMLMSAFVEEPSRGTTGGITNKPLSFKRWISEVNELRKNRSFMFCTLGTTTVKFTAGAFGSWALPFLKRARDIIQGNAPYQTGDWSNNDCLIFGGITVIAGITGITAGVEIAKKCKKYSSCADPIVCGFGLIGASIFLTLAIALADTSLVACYVLIFLEILLLALNTAVSTDIRLYVVSPTKRSTAEAISSLVSQLLGNVGSSYYIGKISAVIKINHPDSALWSFYSLQFALFVCPAVVLIGGGFYLTSTFFIQKDREKAEAESEDCALKEVVVIR